MGPHRKRQRLSEDGAEAVTAEADIGQGVPNGVEEAPNDEQKNQLQQRRSLFIRSLAAIVTTDDLTELFSQSYPIKHATAVLDPATKQCKGYGFVTFADAEDAQRAREEFNGSTLQGRRIKVEIAEPRHREVDTEIRGHKSVPSSATIEAKAVREQQKRETQQPPKLIIRNLPWSIKEPEQLAVLFRSYGKVKHATIPKKKVGLMAGFGFVVMRGRKNAEKAMEGVNGKEVDGRTLAVDWAVEKDAWQDLQNGAQDKHKGAEDGKNLAEEDETSGDGEDAEDTDGVEEEGDSLSNEEGSYDSETDSDAGSIELDHPAGPLKTKSEANTLFVRNLPFTCSDESLKERFSQFGPVRYARIVLDQATERPKGTGFVCFVKESDADDCLKGIPRIRGPQDPKALKKESFTALAAHSVLQSEDADPTGRYTMEGRVLQISRAVDRSEAARLTAEGAAQRFNRDKDKRRLYLLSEGTIPRDSPLYQKLSPSEITMREASAKQRKTLIQSNPSLHLSLTRLSVRNIPRSVTSKDLKALAREAVVGFAKDVKAGTRQRLSKEELARGGEDMKQAEKDRKTRAKGIVKQAKVVFETHDGGKVSEATGAGRSRGYGFIEYYTHRSALMGLRWLNGYAIDYRTKENKGKKTTKEEVLDKKKRLIVEFAIENAQVVSRRSERENKARERPSASSKGGNSGTEKGANQVGKSGQSREKQGTRKRKRDLVEEGDLKDQGRHDGGSAAAKDGKLARRQQIIAKKRMIRRTRKKESKP